MFGLSTVLRPADSASRWSRHAGAWFFILLVLLVSTERRVAELDLEPDDELLLENDDGVAGGEILDRLIVNDDTRLPRSPDFGRVAIAGVVLPPAVSVPDVRLVAKFSRGPPALHFSR